jgi:hypothetical protein
MNCSEYQELLAPRMEGLLDEAALRRLEDHLQSCEACRLEENTLAELHGRLSALTASSPAHSLRKPVMERIAHERKLEERGTVMKKLYTKRFALAASIAVVAIAWAALLMVPGGTGTAYAIGDTVAAQKNVRTVHIKMETAYAGSASEAWAELDGQGNLLRLRMDMPDTSDGPKVVLWQSDKAQVWFKAKNLLLTLGEPNLVKAMPQSFLDPWGEIERLEAQAAAGKFSLETSEAEGEGSYIRVVATSTEVPGAKKVFFVDPMTNLPIRIESYRRAEGVEELVMRMLFLDYDVPLGPEILSPDMPSDINRIDQTAREIGLVKGEMTDVQVAKEVVSQLLDALVARDFATVGRLFEGMPASMAEKELGKMRLLRIISIGEPVPADPKIGGFRVACEVEVESEGKATRSKGSFGVRPVFNQPERWTIHGGSL